MLVLVILIDATCTLVEIIHCHTTRVVLSMRDSCSLLCLRTEVSFLVSFFLGFDLASLATLGNVDLEMVHFYALDTAKTKLNKFNAPPVSE